MAARALILLLAALAIPGAAFGESEIGWREGSEGGELTVCGLAADRLAALDEKRYAEVLAVRTVDPTQAAMSIESLPTLWGRFAAAGGCLSFRPRHQPASGMEIDARFDGPLFDRLTGAQGTASRQLRLPATPPERRTRVVEIAPQGDEVPENLLRLYVTFSGPMSLKGIEKHVRLLDGSGAEIPTAFVDIPDGLWDPGRRRLTLILHPGRVKSGIALGDAMGKVLAAGREITLEVGAEARDADGAALAEGGRRTWRVGPPQSEALDPASFRLHTQAGERGPLEIHFPVALDPALALSAFAVKREDAEIVGTYELKAGERLLLFHPAQPWHRGEPHRVEIGEHLEDAAGNRLGRAFEAASGAPAAKAAGIAFVP